MDNSLRREFKIGKKGIGGNHPVFIIAELSCNHLQRYDIAVKSILAIKKAGADAVKLQTFTPDSITLNCKNECFRIKQGTIWDGKNLYQLYKKAYTPWEWQPKLKKIAENLGLICFSSALDRSAVDFLEEMRVPAYKISSFEITDIPLIEYAASKGKPVLISTGIATLEDIKEAVKACKRKHNYEIALLKCVSGYPADLREMNLRVILDLKKRFKALVGLSDHSLGIIAPVGAVALGAKIIEKHFILSKKLKSLDVAFSLDSDEFREMVTAVRNTEAAMGSMDYKLTRTIKRNREFSRSLFAVKDIARGEVLTEENIRSIRPGFGLAPKYYQRLLGRKAKVQIERGIPLTWDLVDIRKPKK